MPFPCSKDAFFLSHAHLLHIHKIHVHTLLEKMENTAILPGSFKEVIYKEDNTGNCCCYRMFPLSAFSDVSTERLPACSPSLPACHLPAVITIPLFSHLSPFSALLFSLQWHLCGSDCVLSFPLQSCPLSHQAKSISIPLSPCFCLTWPHFALPPALASLQSYTLHLIYLVLLTPSSSHAYCSSALFLERQLHFYYDLAVELIMTCSPQLLATLNT